MKIKILDITKSALPAIFQKVANKADFAVYFFHHKHGIFHHYDYNENTKLCVNINDIKVFGFFKIFHIGCHIPFTQKKTGENTWFSPAMDCNNQSGVVFLFALLHEQ